MSSKDAIKDEQENAQSETFLWQAALLLFLCTIIFYSPCYDFSYTNWDDDPLITRNVLISEISTENLKGIFTPGQIRGETLFIPITYMSYMLEKLFYDGAPDSQVTHAVNILLHGINVSLFLILLCKLGIPRTLAVLGAFIYAFHPLQVETVAWSMGRKDLLASAFTFATLLHWLAWRQNGRLTNIFLAYLLMILAMLSKPTVLIIPALLLVIDIAKKEKSSFNLADKILPIVFALAIFALNQLNKSNLLLAGSSGDASAAVIPELAYRLSCLPWVLNEWLLRTLLIKITIPYYPWPDPSTLNPVMAVIAGFPVFALLGIAAYLIWQKKIQTGGIGLLFWLIAFLPAIWILVDSRVFITADRYGYLPIAGIIIMTLSFCERFLRAKTSLILLASFTLTATCLSWIQCREWRNSLVLWESSLVKMSHPGYTWNQLPYISKTHPFFSDKSNRDLLKDMHPRWVHVLLNTGNAYHEIEDFEMAASMYHLALNLNPAFIKPKRNLASVYLDQKKYQASMNISLDILEENSADYKSRLNLAAAYFHTGKYLEAEAQYNWLVNNGHKSAEVHYFLALTLARQLKINQAIEETEKSLAMQEEFTAAHLLLAKLQLAQQNKSAAIQTLEKLLKYAPNHQKAIALLDSLKSR